MSKDSLQVLKQFMEFIAPITSAIFGIIASASETKQNKTIERKDKNGLLVKEDVRVLTKWGKISIAGIIVSMLISVLIKTSDTILENQESVKKQHEAEEAKKDADNKYNENVKFQSTMNLRSQGILDSLHTTLQNESEVNHQTKRLAFGMSISLLDQKKLAHEQAKAQYQIMRPYFPLEPLTIYYEIAYPMDQPAYQHYSDRIRANMGQLLKTIGKITRGTTREQINDQNKRIFTIAEVTSFTQKKVDNEMLPRDTGNEYWANKELLQDNTLFRFTNDSVQKTLEFSSADCSNLEKKVNKYIYLKVDFPHNTFIKVVKCENVCRSGNDLLTTSAIDLIGRKLTWIADNASIKKYIKVGLSFSYDETIRFVSMDTLASNKNGIIYYNRATIKSSDIGFTDLLTPGIIKK